MLSQRLRALTEDGDPFYAFVRLLFNFEAGAADAKGHAVGTGGLPALAGGALAFDGIDDYFYVVNHADFGLAGSDCCIEGWFEWSALTAAYEFAAAHDQAAGQRGWMIYRDPFRPERPGCLAIDAFPSGGIQQFIGPVVAVGVKYHVALVRRGSDLRIYVDGVNVNTPQNIGAQTMGAMFLPMTLGCTYYSFSPGLFAPVKCYAFRLTVGHHRYQGDDNIAPNFSAPLLFPEK